MLIYFLLQTAFITSIIILSLWIISMIIKDVSIIDTAFAPIIFIITILSIYLSPAASIFKYIIFIIIFIWTVRLTLLMLQRKLGHGEDSRYTKLREWKQPGLNFNIFALWQVFIKQGIVIWLVTLPIQFLLFTSTTLTLNIFNIFGLIVIAAGFFWECVADIQLNQFKRNNTSKKTFLQSGLWSLSRHPNYFGEIMFWWGIYTFSIVNSLALISIVGPIVFSYLIINVTGVKTMDKRMSQNYDGYSEYINSSNSLIPKIFS